MLVRMSTPAIGDPAPEFQADSTDGPLSLRDFRGDWLVLYFYPKDFTGGCTAEACDFRDRLPDLDARVVGVSPDPLDQHRRFRETHGLSFPLVSDEDHSIARAYGAWGTKERDGRTFEGILRSTYLIDPEGRVADALVNVRAEGHVDRVRARLGELRA